MRKQTERFLRGLAVSAYVHTSKQPKLEDFTIQAFQDFKSLQLTSKVTINFYSKEIISQSLQSSVSHTYMLCAFCFCLQESLKMNWIWVYIIWAQKLAVMSFDDN